MGVTKSIGRAGAVALLAGTVGGAALIAAEVALAKTRRYAQPDLRLAIRTSHGPLTAPPIRLVLLGDSSALGVGVDRVVDTVGGRSRRCSLTMRTGLSCPASRSSGRVGKTSIRRYRGPCSDPVRTSR